MYIAACCRYPSSDDITLFPIRGIRGKRILYRYSQQRTLISETPVVIWSDSVLYSDRWEAQDKREGRTTGCFRYLGLM